MRIAHPILRLRGTVINWEDTAQPDGTRLAQVLVRVDGYAKNPVWFPLADVEDAPARKERRHAR